MNNPMASGHDENAAKEMAYFRRFRVKSPVTQKPFRTKGAISLVARLYCICEVYIYQLWDKLLLLSFFLAARQWAALIIVLSRKTWQKTKKQRVNKKKLAGRSRGSPLYRRWDRASGMILQSGLLDSVYFVRVSWVKRPNRRFFHPSQWAWMVFELPRKKRNILTTKLKPILTREKAFYRIKIYFFFQVLVSGIGLKHTTIIIARFLAYCVRVWTRATIEALSYFLAIKYRLKKMAGLPHLTSSKKLQFLFSKYFSLYT